MKFNVSSKETNKFNTDVLVVFCQGDSTVGLNRIAPVLSNLEADFQKSILTIFTDQGFESKLGRFMVVPTFGKIPAKRIIFAGLGEMKDLNYEKWLNLIAKCIGQAKSVKATSIAFLASESQINSITVENYIQGIVTAAELANYKFTKHQSEKSKDPEITDITINLEKIPENAKTINNTAQIMAQATMFARDLVNEPPSTTTPTYLANIAKQIARDNPEIGCEIFDKPEIEKLGMNAFLGIARGSEEAPKFIKLTYKAKNPYHVVIVGKGITFDSGGLSLKPANSMDTMKLDMAGGAVILSVFSALAKLKPNVNITGIIAACENMPSGHSIKPGDIVKALNGKTIEVANTDAEGRVILADAISYAGKYLKPDEIIDFATLTGACMVALGEEITGLFANNVKLGIDLKKAAAETGERVWELPLPEDYKELLKSPVADIKNVSKSHYGGAITGALFIGEFVPKNTPWAHLDIAGPSFAEKDLPLTPYGGTGFGVRMTIQYLMDK
jgi:leucyl aminopeptidase